MTVRLGLLGAGRIGQTHARSVPHIDGAELATVFDPDERAAQAVTQLTGARSAPVEDILADALIDAVIIGTPTDLHAQQIEAAARAGKAIFCEKPIDLDVARVRGCLDVVKAENAPLMIGFNRRFDPHFRAVRRQIEDGTLGTVELVQITSRDPAPPPIDYIRRSGGLFKDMMIHDLDMARFLLGEEIAEVSATGSCLVDPAIAEAGDIDTATVTLRTGSGKLCVITNSRRATYGYDQRLEVHGSKGMASVGNLHPTTLTVANGDGFRQDPTLDFFMQRYQDAYRLELTAFVEAVASGAPMSPDGRDGLKALELAEAAMRSMETGAWVKGLDSGSA